MPGIGESCSRRALWKDPALLEYLIRTYSDPLVRFVYCFVSDSAAAEDIVSDTFAALMVKGGQFSDEEKLRAWLYRVARNRSIDYLRHRSRQVPLEDVENVLGSGDPEADVIRTQRDQTVWICMQALPPQYKTVLQLTYLDGFSVAQTGHIMKKSAKQIYNLLARAKVALKERLIKEGISYEDL